MSRQLNSLKRILAYKFNEQRLLGQVNLRGPILHVGVQYLRGDPVDKAQLTELVQTAVEASMVQRVRKVIVTLTPRSRDPLPPEWTTEFEVDAPMSEFQEGDLKTVQRQDFALVRVIFFGVGMVQILIWLLQPQPVQLIPPVLSGGLGISFPGVKRRILPLLDGWLRGVLLGCGSALFLAALILLWMGLQAQLSSLFPGNLVLLLAIFLLGLGWD